MAKKSLLLVDADPRSLRVLEVSLRKAGYSVATCREAKSALETVDLSVPDLILSDTRLPGTNGFELVQELRKRAGHENVPFMFLSSDGSVESKVRGLELGVEDYLVKPIYIREIITRINLTLQRQEREGLARRTSISKTRFTGSLGDMGLVDLLQTVEISRKSGVLELNADSQRGTVTFRDGQLVDAELGRLRGDAAIYRLLLWNEGEFEIDFRPVRAEQRITSSTQALLMEGMRRIDEWGRLLEQIPSLDNVFEVSDEELVERLAEIPDEINEILRHIDGRRSLMHVVDACEADDLETLTAITKLYFEGIIYPTGRTAGPSGVEELDEEVVPGGSEPEPVPPVESDDEDAPALVPVGPGEPLADEARAKADAPVSSDVADVSERAEDSVPQLAHAAEDPRDPLTGTEAALGLEPFDSAGAARAELDEDPNPDDTSSAPEDREDEDAMAKKGRRRRKVRASAGQEVEAQQEKQEASNVIQFPAQAKRALASSQVAVNDDVSVSSVEAEQVVRAAAEPRREDETEMRARRDESAEPDVEPSEAPGVETAATLPLDAVPAPSAEPPAEAKSEPAPSAKPAPSAEAKPEPPVEAKPEPPVEMKSEVPAQRKSEPPKEHARHAEDARGKKKKGKHERSSSVPPPRGKHDSEPPKKPDSEPRPKKQGTTSAEIRAVSTTGEHQAVAEDFFRSSERIGKVDHETWDDLQKEALPLSNGMKQAKYATFAILTAGLALIGGFLVYQNVWMPRPVELSGASRPPELPDGFQRGNDEAEPPTPSVATADPVAPPVADTTPAEPVVVPDEADPVPVVEDVAVAVAPPAPAPAPEPAPVVAPPTPAPAPAGEDAAALAQQAYRALNRSRNEEALQLAQRAITADQTSALGWLVLGAARQELRDTAGARTAYDSCVEHGTETRHVRDCRAMLRSLPR